ncbi:hypothetical protein FB564_1109 [Salinispora arenicola]|uniref:Uncharacterized protein n=1 Tax=Salinispora arenicola TaxID=168697 RepID=A0A542XJK2_SALAC|nr:hypothetical protein FB564_1109 [Salinispora arenicola]
MGFSLWHRHAAGQSPGRVTVVLAQLILISCWAVISPPLIS